MQTEDKQKIIEAMLVAGLSLASKAFKPSKAQIERFDTLANKLDSSILSAITTDFEDVLTVVEEYINGENTNA